MARALDTKIVPDSMGIRHIVLPYTQEALADSLLTVLKGGADFAQVAAQYSVYDATAANGGEVGVMPFSAFSGEFAAALANAKTGDIVTNRRSTFRSLRSPTRSRLRPLPAATSTIRPAPSR